jgi:hypothetical protein
MAVWQSVHGKSQATTQAYMGKIKSKKEEISKKKKIKVRHF